MRNFKIVLLLIFILMSTFFSVGQRDKNWSEKEVDSLLKKVELIPLMVNGDKDNRINIVIMNRWSSNDKSPYNSPEMRSEFIEDINESLIAALTPGDERAHTAYANYRDYFNVYGLWYPDSPEWDKGIDGNMVDALRDKMFLPWKDEHLGWVTFLVMPNTDGGGGGAARNLEERTGRALIVGNQIAKMLHEIAHTCISIGDEYTGSATGTSADPTYTVSNEYDRDKIKWRKWIEADTPLPTPYTKEYKDKIGAFEGAQYHLVDYYRSTAQGCIMGSGVFDNTEKMCPICEQRLAMRVNKLVNPIKSFQPVNSFLEISGKTKLHFEIDYIKPIPNTQVVRWILNDKVIAKGTDKIDIEFGELADYKLTCVLTDESHFIRPDPPFAEYPTREISWNISNKAPISKANKLELSVQRKEKKTGTDLEAVVSGGRAPFTYLWSNGNTTNTLKNVEADIYEVQVTDSDFRTQTAKYSLYNSTIKSDISASNNKNESSNAFNVDIDVTASDKGKDNGKLEVIADGGVAPYTYVWKDAKQEFPLGKVYEAEDASIAISGHTIKEYFDAHNNKLVTFNENEGTITWTVEVAKSGTYPIDIVYAGVARGGTPMDIQVNGKVVKKSLTFLPTRPLFIGWEKSTIKAYLDEGVNEISLVSIGKSGANIDYLRVPTTFNEKAITDSNRFNLKHGEYTVVVTDMKNKSVEKTINVPQAYPFVVENIEFECNKPGVLNIVNPLADYRYLWYSDNTPLFKDEKFEKPIFEGVDFTPSKPGRYYVSAKNKNSDVESKNRICISIGDKQKTISSKEINPSFLSQDHIKLWFDASDLDGDGNKDGHIPERGPLKDWTEKTWRNPGKIFAKYEPNKLNGMGVCAFGNVWVSDLGKKVSDIQTVILVYKESSLTFPGMFIFRDLNKYLGLSREPEKRFFDLDFVDKKTKEAKVYLNGELVDPFNTPNPMNFCILTVEFPSIITDSFSRVEGYWEGDIAEMIFIDKVLSETERKGVEEYLRKKWFSSIDIEF